MPTTRRGRPGTAPGRAADCVDELLDRLDERHRIGEFGVAEAETDSLVASILGDIVVWHPDDLKGIRRPQCLLTGPPR